MSPASPARATAPPPPVQSGPRYRFVGEFPRVRPSIWYLLALTLTAASLILIPLLYLALIAGIGYGVAYYAQHSLSVFDALPNNPRAIIVATALYICPIVMGIVLVFFLLKPLVARRVDREHPITLDPSQEPMLFSFIEELCAALGAPMPREIEVSCAANAAAGFRRGLRSFFGADLTLHIGLSLVAGLTLQQFAGVLAHELGHFSEGAGMRLVYIIDKLNTRLFLAAYGRDEWDARLYIASQTRNYRVPAYLLRGLVWLTRRIIVVLAHVGQVVSCYAMRQREYHADAFEATVYGSAHFRETTLALARLDYAAGLTLGQLRSSWRDRRLVDNLPAFVAQTAAKLNRQAIDALTEKHAQGKTRLFDTHPCDADRILAAERLNAPGILKANGPAMALMSNFTMAANGLTLRFYRDVIGLTVDSENLVTVDIVHQRAKTDERAYKSMVRYFQDCLSFARPFDLPSECPPASDLRAEAARLKSLRARIEAETPKLAPAYQRQSEQAARMRVLARADALTRSGVSLPIAAWGLTAPGLQAVTAAVRAAEREIAEIDRSHADYRQMARDRLVCALQLGAAPQVMAKVRDGEARSFAARAQLEIAARFASIAPLIVAMHSAIIALESLFRRCPDGRVPDQYPLLLSVASNLTETINQCIIEIRELLVDLLYPFEHAHGPISLANFLGPRLPPKHTAIDAFLAGREMVDRLHELQARVLGNLTLYAESVEAVLGLARLPDPPERPSPTDDEPEEIKPTK